MATVVNLGANRVDPSLQLGQAIEKGAARLADVMMAQNQREWQEKMRREAEERADKRQKEQDKRLLNRQIALENNKRVYEQNQKKADAINNARLYDLVNSVSKENKYGKRVIDPRHSTNFLKHSAALLPYTDSKTQEQFYKRVGEYEKNQAESRGIDLQVEALVTAGVPRNIATIMYDQPLNEIREYQTAVIDAQGPGLRGMVASGAFDLDVLHMTDMPRNAPPGKRQAWTKWNKYVTSRNLSHNDAFRLLSEDGFLTEYKKNQQALMGLQRVYSKHPALASNKDLVDTIIGYNIDAPATKEMLDELVKVGTDENVKLAVAGIKDSLKNRTEPDDKHITILNNAGGAFATFADSAISQWQKKINFDHEFKAGAKIVNSIAKEPGKNWALDPDVNEYLHVPQVKDALQLSAIINMAQHADYFEGMSDDARREQEADIFAKYRHDPNAFGKLIESHMAQQAYHGPVYAAMNKLKSGQSLSDTEVQRLMGVVATFDVPGEETLMTNFVNSYDTTESIVIGDKTYKVTPKNLAGMLKVQLQFDTAGKTEEAQEAYTALTLHSMSSYGEPNYLSNDELKLHMANLPPGELDNVMDKLGNQKVASLRLDGAINSGLIPGRLRSSYEFLPLDQLNAQIDNLEADRSKKADDRLSAWLSDPNKQRAGALPNMTDFSYASQPVKTALLTSMRAEVARQYEADVAQQTYERDVEGRVAMLAGLGIFDYKKSLHKAFIDGAATSESATNTIIRQAMAFQNADKKAQAKMGEDFVIEAIWKPFFKDFSGVLGGTGLSVDVQGWDSVNNIPLMESGGRKLNKDDIDNLRSIRTNYNLYENWLKSSSIDKGLLGGSFLSGEKGQRQISIATATLIQDIFEKALASGAIPNFSEVLTYAHGVTATLNYDDTEIINLDPQGKWGRLSDLGKVYKDLGRTDPWKKHNLKVNPVAKEIQNTTPTIVKREASYARHFSNNPHMQGEFQTKIAEQKSNGNYVWPGATAVERNKNATQYMLNWSAPVPTADDGTLVPYNPANQKIVFDYNRAMQLQYHLYKALEGAWPNDAQIGKFGDVFAEKMKSEMARLKDTMPVTTEANRSMLTTGSAMASEDVLTHSPLGPMSEEVYKQYYAPNSPYRTAKQFNYLMTRLKVLQGIFKNNLNGGNEY